MLIKQLTIFASILPISLSLKCRHRIINPGETLTLPDCDGSLCAIWSNQNSTIVQGCVSGAVGLKTGCRRNIVGATLCLCANEDLCNDRLLLRQTVEQLLVIKCKHYANQPYVLQDHIGEAPPVPSCNGNACFFRKDRIRNQKGRLTVLTSGYCSNIPKHTFDMELATNWPGPGARPGFCYKLETTNNQSSLGCMCKEDDCNARQPFQMWLSHQNTRCFAINRSTTDDEGQMEVCQGQYCFIQRTFDRPTSRFTLIKGCLSTSDKDLKTGFRDFFGVEQWICAQELCNSNVTYAMASFASQSTATAAQTKGGQTLILTKFSGFLVVFCGVLFVIAYSRIIVP